MNHTSISFPLGGCCKSLDNDNESSQSPRIYLKGKNINYLTRVLKKLRHVNTSILILKNLFFPFTLLNSCLKTWGLPFILVRGGLDFRSIWWSSDLKMVCPWEYLKCQSVWQILPNIFSKYQLDIFWDFLSFVHTCFSTPFTNIRPLYFTRTQALMSCSMSPEQEFGLSARPGGGSHAGFTRLTQNRAVLISSACLAVEGLAKPSCGSPPAPVLHAACSATTEHGKEKGEAKCAQLTQATRGHLQAQDIYMVNTSKEDVSEPLG